VAKQGKYKAVIYVEEDGKLFGKVIETTLKI